mgnify:FL=1
MFSKNQGQAQFPMMKPSAMDMNYITGKNILFVLQKEETILSGYLFREPTREKAKCVKTISRKTFY